MITSAQQTCAVWAGTLGKEKPRKIRRNSVSREFIYLRAVFHRLSPRSFVLGYMTCCTHTHKRATWQKIKKNNNNKGSRNRVVPSGRSSGTKTPNDSSRRIRDNIIGGVRAHGYGLLNSGKTPPSFVLFPIPVNAPTSHTTRFNPTTLCVRHHVRFGSATLETIL